MSENPQFAELQSTVAKYLTTPKGQLSVALDEVFTSDAVVHDDGHTYIGIDAIAAWTNEVAAAFTFTRTVISVIAQPNAAIVAVLVKGDFPGSPVELHHHFSLTGDRISALTICT
jgi:hypothetical protein